jgi:hypothetical protein
MLATITRRFEQWGAGKLQYEHQQGELVCAIKWFIAALDDELEELRSLQSASDELKTEIDERIADILRQHYVAVEMNNLIADVAREGTRAKNASFDPAWEMPSFGHGWIRPARDAAGQQTIVVTCCNPSCQSEHIFEFQTRDGFIEFRSFAKEKDDERIGAGETSYGDRPMGVAGNGCAANGSRASHGGFAESPTGGG